MRVSIQSGLVKAIVFTLTLLMTRADAQQPSPNLSVAPQAEKKQQTQPQQQNQQGVRQGRLNPTPRGNTGLGQQQQTDPVQSASQAPILNPQLSPAVPSARHHRRGPRSNVSPHPSGSPAARPTQNGRGYAEALQRYRRERHPQVWWKQHYTVIVLVLGGYYYYDNGYWCPAWGYDSSYQYYDYDGPIYTYGNLLPDQVIANVQRALKELGYYAGAISGALTQATRAAIAAFQEDNGLDPTGVIDPDLTVALGLE